METKVYTTLDKSSWPQGPWQNEPDKIQWEDEVTKMPCLAVRNRYAGAWCGYVGVGENHKYFAVSYEELYNLNVHGALTFSDFCDPSHEEDQKICHVTGDGESDRIWWLGFDCNHMCDYAPNDKWVSESGKYRYKTLEYVKQECRKLAAQLVHV